VAKGARSLKLASELEDEILALKGTYVGTNLSEIITFMLKDWLKTNKDYVRKLKRESGRARAGKRSI
jgi:hypothetical protein